MRISSKGRMGIGILGIVVASGLVLMWAWNQGTVPSVPTSITDVPKPVSNAPVAVTPKAATNVGEMVAANGAASTDPQTPDDKPEVPEPKTWEDHLDDILLSDDNNNAKADQVLALIQTVTPDHQEELAQHLVNLAEDDHYEGTSNLLMNINTATNVSEILMSDLLNRNNKLKLNTLLAIVKMPEHPLHDNAKEMLELFVQDDHGTDNAAWDKAVADWLKENEPDAQAQAQAQAQVGDPNAPAPQ